MQTGLVIAAVDEISCIYKMDEFFCLLKRKRGETKKMPICTARLKEGVLCAKEDQGKGGFVLSVCWSGAATITVNVCVCVSHLSVGHLATRVQPLKRVHRRINRLL